MTKKKEIQALPYDARKDTHLSLIYIKWADAFSPPKGWHHGNEPWEFAADNEDWIVEEVAFLLYECEEYLLLAAKCGGSDPCFGGITKLPRPWIQEKKVLKRVKWRNKPPEEE